MDTKSIHRFNLLLGFLLLHVARLVWGHAKMVEPPSRSTMWRFGYDTAINYDDNELFCGGYRNTVMFNGKCGVCGDPYQGPYENEAGGVYATGIIARRYAVNERLINITIDVTAFHKGYFQFRICPNNNVNERVKQSCLDRYLLKVKTDTYQNDETRYYPSGKGGHHMQIILPEGLTCRQCVLQWTYKTGNFWGINENGTSCMGCGIQELFVNCADISIGYGADNAEVIRKQKAKAEIASSVAREVQSQKVQEEVSLVEVHRNNILKIVNEANVRNMKLSENSTSEECNRCYALPMWSHYSGMNDWCDRNCKKGNCPPCRCYCGCPNLQFDNPCVSKGEPGGANLVSWCWRECCEFECPTDKCECSIDIQDSSAGLYGTGTEFFDIGLGNIVTQKSSPEINSSPPKFNNVTIDVLSPGIKPTRASGKESSRKRASTGSIQGLITSSIKRPVNSPIKRPVKSSIKRPVISLLKRPIISSIKRPIISSIKRPVISLIKRPVSSSKKGTVTLHKTRNMKKNNEEKNVKPIVSSATEIEIKQHKKELSKLAKEAVFSSMDHVMRLLFGAAYTTVDRSRVYDVLNDNLSKRLDKSLDKPGGLKIIDYESNRPGFQAQKKIRLPPNHLTSARGKKSNTLGKTSRKTPGRTNHLKRSKPGPRALVKEQLPGHSSNEGKVKLTHTKGFDKAKTISDLKIKGKKVSKSNNLTVNNTKEKLNFDSKDLMSSNVIDKIFEDVLSLPVTEGNSKVHFLFETNSTTSFPKGPITRKSNDSATKHHSHKKSGGKFVSKSDSVPLSARSNVSKPSNEAKKTYPRVAKSEISKKSLTIVSDSRKGMKSSNIDNLKESDLFNQQDVGPTKQSGKTSGSVKSKVQFKEEEEQEFIAPKTGSKISEEKVNLTVPDLSIFNEQSSFLKDLKNKTGIRLRFLDDSPNENTELIFGNRVLVTTEVPVGKVNVAQRSRAESTTRPPVIRTSTDQKKEAIKSVHRQTEETTVLNPIDGDGDKDMQSNLTKEPKENHLMMLNKKSSKNPNVADKTSKPLRRIFFQDDPPTEAPALNLISESKVLKSLFDIDGLFSPERGSRLSASDKFKVSNRVDLRSQSKHSQTTLLDYTNVPKIFSDRPVRLRFKDPEEPLHSSTVQIHPTEGLPVAIVKPTWGIYGPVSPLDEKRDQSLNANDVTEISTPMQANLFTNEKLPLSNSGLGILVRLPSSTGETPGEIVSDSTSPSGYTTNLENGNERVGHVTTSPVQPTSSPSVKVEQFTSALGLKSAKTLSNSENTPFNTKEQNKLEHKSPTSVTQTETTTIRLDLKSTNTLIDTVKRAENTSFDTEEQTILEPGTPLLLPQTETTTTVLDLKSTTSFIGPENSFISNEEQNMLVPEISLPLTQSKATTIGLYRQDEAHKKTLTTVEKRNENSTASFIDVELGLSLPTQEQKSIVTSVQTSLSLPETPQTTYAHITTSTTSRPSRSRKLEMTPNVHGTNNSIPIIKEVTELENESDHYLSTTVGSKFQSATTKSSLTSVPGTQGITESTAAHESTTTPQPPQPKTTENTQPSQNRNDEGPVSIPEVWTSGDGSDQYISTTEPSKFESSSIQNSFLLTEANVRTTEGTPSLPLQGIDANNTEKIFSNTTEGAHLNRVSLSDTRKTTTAAEQNRDRMSTKPIAKNQEAPSPAVFELHSNVDEASPEISGNSVFMPTSTATVDLTEKHNEKSFLSLARTLFRSSKGVLPNTEESSDSQSATVRPIHSSTIKVVMHARETNVKTITEELNNTQSAQSTPFYLSTATVIQPTTRMEDPSITNSQSTAITQSHLTRATVIQPTTGTQDPSITEESTNSKSEAITQSHLTKAAAVELSTGTEYPSVTEESTNSKSEVVSQSHLNKANVVQSTTGTEDPSITEESTNSKSEVVSQSHLNTAHEVQSTKSTHGEIVETMSQNIEEEETLTSITLPFTTALEKSTLTTHGIQYAYGKTPATLREEISLEKRATKLHDINPSTPFQTTSMPEIPSKDTSIVVIGHPKGEENVGGITPGPLAKSALFVTSADKKEMRGENDQKGKLDPKDYPPLPPRPPPLFLSDYTTPTSQVGESFYLTTRDDSAISNREPIETTTMPMTSTEELIPRSTYRATTETSKGRQKPGIKTSATTVPSARASTSPATTPLASSSREPSLSPVPTTTLSTTTALFLNSLFSSQYSPEQTTSSLKDEGTKSSNSIDNPQYALGDSDLESDLNQTNSDKSHLSETGKSSLSQKGALEKNQSMSLLSNGNSTENIRSKQYPVSERKVKLFQKMLAKTFLNNLQSNQTSDSEKDIPLKQNSTQSLLADKLPKTLNEGQNVTLKVSERQNHFKPLRNTTASDEAPGMKRPFGTTVDKTITPPGPQSKIQEGKSNGHSKLDLSHKNTVLSKGDTHFTKAESSQLTPKMNGLGEVVNKQARQPGRKSLLSQFYPVKRTRLQERGKNTPLNSRKNSTEAFVSKSSVDEDDDIPDKHLHKHLQNARLTRVRSSRNISINIADVKISEPHDFDYLVSRVKIPKTKPSRITQKSINNVKKKHSLNRNMLSKRTSLSKINALSKTTFSKSSSPGKTTLSERNTLFKQFLLSKARAFPRAGQKSSVKNSRLQQNARPSTEKIIREKGASTSSRRTVSENQKTPNKGNTLTAHRRALPNRTAVKRQGAPKRTQNNSKAGRNSVSLRPNPNQQRGQKRTTNISAAHKTTMAKIPTINRQNTPTLKSNNSATRRDTASNKAVMNRQVAQKKATRTSDSGRNSVGTRTLQSQQRRLNETQGRRTSRRQTSLNQLSMAQKGTTNLSSKHKSITETTRDRDRSTKTNMSKSTITKGRRTRKQITSNMKTSSRSMPINKSLPKGTSSNRNRSKNTRVSQTGTSLMNRRMNTTKPQATTSQSGNRNAPLSSATALNRQKTTLAPLSNSTVSNRGSSGKMFLSKITTSNRERFMSTMLKSKSSNKGQSTNAHVSKATTPNRVRSRNTSISKATISNTNRSKSTSVAKGTPLKNTKPRTTPVSSPTTSTGNRSRKTSLSKTTSSNRRGSGSSTVSKSIASNRPRSRDTSVSNPATQKRGSSKKAPVTKSIMAKRGKSHANPTVGNQRTSTVGKETKSTIKPKTSSKMTWEEAWREATGEDLFSDTFTSNTRPTSTTTIKTTTTEKPTTVTKSATLNTTTIRPRTISREHLKNSTLQIFKTIFIAPTVKKSELQNNSSTIDRSQRGMDIRVIDKILNSIKNWLGRIQVIVIE